MLLFYIIFGDHNLPYLALGSNIPSARRPEQQFHFLQSRGSSPSLCFVNRHGGTLRRAGWVASTETYSRGKWLISHLPATFAIIIHIPRPLRHCIWRPRVPVPHVPASHTWCPQVPRLASPRPKSPHTRSDVQVPLSPSYVYTQPQALTRRQVQIPIVDEILQIMEGATVFTEVDLSQDYLQVTIAQESRCITAF